MPSCTAICLRNSCGISGTDVVCGAISALKHTNRATEKVARMYGGKVSGYVLMLVVLGTDTWRHSYTTLIHCVAGLR
eukprot:3264495-Rhodomonas_salina.1